MVPAYDLIDMASAAPAAFLCALGIRLLRCC